MSKNHTNIAGTNLLENYETCDDAVESLLILPNDCLNTMKKVQNREKS